MQRDFLCPQRLNPCGAYVASHSCTAETLFAKVQINKIYF